MQVCISVLSRPWQLPSCSSHYATAAIAEPIVLKCNLIDVVHRLSGSCDIVLTASFAQAVHCCCMQAEWGQHSLAEAARRLYIAALRDRANARFVMLSDSCVFLYPPATVYLESLAAHRSRINACILPEEDDWTRNIDR